MDATGHYIELGLCCLRSLKISDRDVSQCSQKRTETEYWDTFLALIFNVTWYLFIFSKTLKKKVFLTTRNTFARTFPAMFAGKRDLLAVLAVRHTWIEREALLPNECRHDVTWHAFAQICGQLFIFPPTPKITAFPWFCVRFRDPGGTDYRTDRYTTRVCDWRFYWPRPNALFKRSVIVF